MQERREQVDFLTQRTIRKVEYHHKNFVNRCPSQFIEKLQRENEELKRKKKEPDVNKKQNAIIFKEIAEIKENFEKQMLAPKLQRRQAAEKQLNQCYQQLTQVTKKNRETEWTQANIFRLKAYEIEEKAVTTLIGLNQSFIAQQDQENKNYYKVLYEEIISMFERFAKLTETEENFERPNVPRSPQQPRSAQIRITNFQFNP